MDCTVVMDSAMQSIHPRPRRCVRLFCDYSHDPPGQDQPGGRRQRGVFSLGRRPLLKGGVVTPRPPCRLAATYTGSNWLRSALAFSGLAKEGQRA